MAHVVVNQCGMSGVAEEEEEEEEDYAQRVLRVLP
jgi:hypothetical protein